MFKIEFWIEDWISLFKKQLNHQSTIINFPGFVTTRPGLVPSGFLLVSSVEEDSTRSLESSAWLASVGEKCSWSWGGEPSPRAESKERGEIVGLPMFSKEWKDNHIQLPYTRSLDRGDNITLCSTVDGYNSLSWTDSHGWTCTVVHWTQTLWSTSLTLLYTFICCYVMCSDIVCYTCESTG